MKDRSDCTMSEAFCNKVYCAYYDIGVRLCTDVKTCPEEEGYPYDEDDYEDDYKIDDLNNY